MLKTILLGTLSATIFSASLYLSYFGIEIKLLNTILAVFAFYTLLYFPKKSVVVAGFFIGLLWFYWIGFSFKYYNMGFMSPIISLSYGVLYALVFSTIAISNKIYIRAMVVFLLSYFAPFDWNWLQMQLLFVHSYIGVFKYQFILVLLSLVLFNYLKNSYKYLAFLIIPLAFELTPYHQQKAPLKIKLIQTHVKQSEKWLPQNRVFLTMQNLRYIQKAIKNRYDLVVLPESTFPYFMNHNPQVIKKLQELSKHITILTGSLYEQNKKNYNVSYLFQDGKITIAKKVILVPFGEYIPLPKFLKDIVNNYFFNGEEDFTPAKHTTDFIIKGVKFRNAICYEATTQRLFQGDVKYMLAISNNAWFEPSIEPTLQKLLLEFYAKINGTTIYHSANWAGTGVIR